MLPGRTTVSVVSVMGGSVRPGCVVCRLRYTGAALFPAAEGRVPPSALAGGEGKNWRRCTPVGMPPPPPWPIAMVAEERSRQEDGGGAGCSSMPDGSGANAPFGRKERSEEFCEVRGDAACRRSGGGLDDPLAINGDNAASPPGDAALAGGRVDSVPVTDADASSTGRL